MRLCMFHPNDNPMDRGWVGRLDGDRVLHLAAQTLQSLFLGGGGAREHAEYALADVTLLVPVQYPPLGRILFLEGCFGFANATAVVGPNVPVEGGALSAFARIAAVIGAADEIGGYSAMVQWQDPSERPGVKTSDFGIALGPAVALAGRRTVLRAGDVIAGPPLVVLDDVNGGVQLEVEGIGTLACPLR